MATRADVLARLPSVQGLSASEAAAFIGISASTFAELVSNGVMPRPRVIKARRVWDIDEVRAAFKSLPTDEDDADAPQAPAPHNPWDAK